MGPANYEFLLFDDLKFSSMAKSMLFNRGDFDMGCELWNGNMNQREIRQVLLQDEIQNLEKVEENFNERDSRI